jgi:hypothetical protein
MFQRITKVTSVFAIILIIVLAPACTITKQNSARSEAPGQKKKVTGEPAKTYAPGQQKKRIN